ncbi:uncharacterized protein LOC144120461 [Amblyomma americanum]
MRSLNPFCLAMQVIAPLWITTLFPAPLAACPPDISPEWTPALNRTDMCQPCAITASLDRALTSPVHCTLDRQLETPSPSTSSPAPAFKQLRPPASPCGLGGCATMRSLNPFCLAMQVSKPCCLYAKKSSDYFLIQLPSPQCCLAIVTECSDVIISLLLLSGDIETNPGPASLETVVTELKKLSAGQSTIIAEVTDLKNQLLTTDNLISDLSRRIRALEGHYQTIQSLRTEIEGLSTHTTQATRQLCDLEDRIDEAENQSRRNNLIFYNIPDPDPSETWADSEKLLIRHCSEFLDITLDPKTIDRTHRLGRHEPDRCRPLIAKFALFKTKDEILANGRKFKDTDYSVGEDFSRRVRNVRKHLVTFAKSKTNRFSLRYKTLFIGSRRYIFDEPSQSVKEIP